MIIKMCATSISGCINDNIYTCVYIYDSDILIWNNIIRSVEVINLILWALSTQISYEKQKYLYGDNESNKSIWMLKCYINIVDDNRRWFWAANANLYFRNLQCRNYFVKFRRGICRNSHKNLGDVAYEHWMSQKMNIGPFFKRPLWTS